MSRPVPTFSLDWNCALAVENGEASAPFVERLVDAHRQSVADVAVLQTSASENVRGTRGFPDDYSGFEERLRELRWEHLPRVPTPGVWGLTFWDRCFYVGGAEYDALAGKLWALIAPNVAPLSADFSASKRLRPEITISDREFSRWRNVWCDVHSAYAHIHAHRDLFVTSNTSDFQARSGDLRALGLVAVTPEEAVKNLP